MGNDESAGWKFAEQPAKSGVYLVSRDEGLTRAVRIVDVRTDRIWWTAGSYSLIAISTSIAVFIIAVALRIYNGW